MDPNKVGPIYDGLHRVINGRSDHRPRPDRRQDVPGLPDRRDPAGQDRHRPGPGEPAARTTRRCSPRSSRPAATATRSPRTSRRRLRRRRPRHRWCGACSRPSGARSQADPVELVRSSSTSISGRRDLPNLLRRFRLPAGRHHDVDRPSGELHPAAAPAPEPRQHPLQPERSAPQHRLGADAGHPRRRPCVGLLAIYSASRPLPARQRGSTRTPTPNAKSSSSSPAPLVMAAVMSIDYGAIKERSGALYLGTIVALLAVLIVGTGPPGSGANAWFDLGPILVQPSEFAKVTVLILVAGYLAEERSGDLSYAPVRHRADAGRRAGRAGACSSPTSAPRRCSSPSPWGSCSSPGPACATSCSSASSPRPRSAR